MPGYVFKNMHIKFDEARSSGAELYTSVKTLMQNFNADVDANVDANANANANADANVWMRSIPLCSTSLR